MYLDTYLRTCVRMHAQWSIAPTSWRIFLLFLNFSELVSVHLRFPRKKIYLYVELTRCSSRKFVFGATISRAASRYTDSRSVRIKSMGPLRLRRGPLQSFPYATAGDIIVIEPWAKLSRKYRLGAIFFKTDTKLRREFGAQCCVNRGPTAMSGFRVSG